MEELEFFVAATDMLNKYVESGSVEYFINDMTELFDERQDDKLEANNGN